MERLFVLSARGIQYTDAEEFSAYSFLGWIHHAIYGLAKQRLAGYRGARDELIFQPLARYLTQRGATIRTGVKLEQIFYDSEQRRVTGFGLSTKDHVEADVYEVAVPAWGFAALIPPALREDSFFQRITQLPVAPAISAQIWCNHQVTDTPEFFLIPSPTREEITKWTQLSCKFREWSATHAPRTSRRPSGT